MNDKILIDTIVFNTPLETNYKEIFSMFDSTHEYCCCERHELDFDSSEQDFKMVEDVLDKIEKLEIYGEEDMGVTFFFYDGNKRVGVFVPGRGSNNGYYGSDIELIIETPKDGVFKYDVSEYQDITE